MKLREVKGIATRCIAELHPFCKRIEITSDIRRGVPNPKDHQLVCIVKTIEQLTLYEEEIKIRKPIAALNSIVNQREAVKKLATGIYTQPIFREGVRFHLSLVLEINWGYQVAIRTGSKSFIHKLERRWTKLGYTGDNSYLRKNGLFIPVREEQDLFKLLRIPFIDPCNRV